LRNSFRPPEEIRAVRTIWRQRDQWVKEAARAVQQMQKALIAMNVQLANAISDISGVTGQAILRSIVAGTRDPWELAKLRDKRIAASDEEIAHSLQGNWREEVVFELQAYVDLGAAHYEAKRQQRERVALQRTATALGMKLVPAT
jgi:hypothetical protein